MTHPVDCRCERPDEARIHRATHRLNDPLVIEEEHIRRGNHEVATFVGVFHVVS